MARKRKVKHYAAFCLGCGKIVIVANPKQIKGKIEVLHA